MELPLLNYNYFFYGAGGLIFLLAIWILFLELRLKKLFKGKKADNLENVLISLGEDIKKLYDSKDEMEKYLLTAEKRIRNSVQRVKTVRFNPFGDAGSNQSFTISFLNEHGDGVVLSGLYSRDKINVFAKPIEKYESKYALSNEEKEAIKK